MDFLPEDMEAVQACLAGIDRNVPVSVEPAAAALLLPQTVYKVADLLALPEWPASQLRLVIERWQARHRGPDRTHPLWRRAVPFAPHRTATSSGIETG